MYLWQSNLEKKQWTDVFPLRHCPVASRMDDTGQWCEVFLCDIHDFCPKNVVPIPILVNTSILEDNVSFFHTPEISRFLSIRLGIWFLLQFDISLFISPTHKSLFPHIFVWGSCFWFCIPGFSSSSRRLRNTTHTNLTYNNFTHKLNTHKLNRQ